MTCGSVRKLTSAYVEGEITAEERRHVEGHLGTCAKCQATIDEVGRLMNAVQSLRPARVSRGFVDAVMARVAESGEVRTVRREWAWPTLPTIRIPGLVWGPALAAAAVAVVVFVPRATRTTPHDALTTPASVTARAASEPTTRPSLPTMTGVTQVASSGTRRARIPAPRHVAPAGADAAPGSEVARVNPIMSTQAVGSGGVMLDGTRLDATPAEVYWILDEVSAENAGVLQRASTTAPSTRPAHKKSLTF